MQIKRQIERRAARVKKRASRATEKVSATVKTATERLPTPSIPDAIPELPGRIKDRLTSSGDDTSDTRDAGVADSKPAGSAKNPVDVDELLRNATAARKRAIELAEERSSEASAAAADAEELIAKARRAAEDHAEQARITATRAIERARELATDALTSSQRLDEVRLLGSGDASDQHDEPDDDASADASADDGPESTDLTEKTKDELYELAQEHDIPGRSAMNKDELIDALTDR